MSAAAKPSTKPAEVIDLEVALPGRDRLHLHLEVHNGEIASAELKGSGCRAFLMLLQDWRSKLKGPLNQLSLPQGHDHSSMLLREALLKAKGEWKFPYDEEELCHCRRVPTAKVDAAIVGGCHTAQQVARETSAGTSCGACRVDTDKIIAYRKG